MKNLTSLTKDHKIPPGDNNFISPGTSSRPRLAGFAKVLAGGRVVKLDNTKTFGERFLGYDIPSSNSSPGLSSDQAILETIVANLEAGVNLIDKQELSLAKFGGRLAEIALALNKARETPEHADMAQSDFERSRNCLRSIAKETLIIRHFFQMVHRSQSQLPYLLKITGKDYQLTGVTWLNPVYFQLIGAKSAQRQLVYSWIVKVFSVHSRNGGSCA